jgi:hypothetical protein
LKSQLWEKSEFSAEERLAGKEKTQVTEKGHSNLEYSGCVKRVVHSAASGGRLPLPH